MSNEVQDLQAKEEAHKRRGWLSPLNPWHWMILLWWIFIAPAQLKAYREAFDDESKVRLSKVRAWLVGALIFTPLLLMWLGVTDEALQRLAQLYIKDVSGAKTANFEWIANHWNWFGLAICSSWVSTSLHPVWRLADDVPTPTDTTATRAKVITLVMVILVAGVVNAVVFIVAVGLAGSVLVGLAGVVVVIVACGTTIAVTAWEDGDSLRNVVSGIVEEQAVIVKGVVQQTHYQIQGLVAASVVLFVAIGVTVLTVGYVVSAGASEAVDVASKFESATADLVAGVEPEVVERLAPPAVKATLVVASFIAVGSLVMIVLEFFLFIAPSGLIALLKVYEYVRISVEGLEQTLKEQTLKEQALIVTRLIFMALLGSYAVLLWQVGVKFFHWFQLF